MKLDQIKVQIPLLAGILRGKDGNLHRYKYTMLEHFRNGWDMKDDDFMAMFDHCLESDTTRRWWKREGYRPKESLLLLISAEPHLIKKAFDALFNEDHEIENRIDRFIYYCDDVLKLYKRAEPMSVVNNHYQDSAMISFYLAAMYPWKYCLYPGRVIFNKALEVLGAAGTGEKDDLPRYFKVSRILHQYLIKDSSIKALIDNGLRPEDNLVLAHEFIMAIAGRWNDVAPA